MSRPRFLADSMLGTLVKKLRLLGMDTAYIVNADDSKLKYIVRSQNRVLLTKSERLAGSLGNSAWLVEGGDVNEEFNSIAHKVSAAAGHPDPFSRCLDCNETLIVIHPSQTEGKVPPYIQISHRLFSRCPSCGKVFWEGTHRKRMEEDVEWMREKLRNT